MSRQRYTVTERRIIASCRTPRMTQRWIRSLRYNWERSGRSLLSFRGVVRRRAAHCVEAALAAAAIMEYHGWPPLLLDLQSQDRLDHVVFAFCHRGRWGAIGASRDAGLHGRRPVFRSLRALALSYYEPYVDLTARIVAFGLVDLQRFRWYDWRTSTRNMWKIEPFIDSQPHERLPTDDARYRTLRAAYRAYLEHGPASGTPHVRGRHTWM
ncbi:MAG TPA: hypothetical protein VGA37_15450 [Gemmatimonadales bacterium]